MAIDRTPAVTPGDTVGAGTVLAFLTLAGTAGSENVQLAAVAAAALVALFTVRAHADLRIVRNGVKLAELKGGE
jgi:hypothetical protein